MSMHTKQEPDKSEQNSSETATTGETAKAAKSVCTAADAQRIPAWAMTCGDGLPPGLVLQTKLMVSQSGNLYEQEADRVAEQVMRATDLQTSVSTDQEQAKHSLLSKPNTEPGASSATQSPDVPPIVHDVLNSGAGQPLDTTTQAFIEPRFDYDFSQVRVHTDAKAAESAQAVNALAYTVGPDVVFGAGQYIPHSNAGQRLMAHELTHVVQQSGSDGIRVDQSNEKLGHSPSSQAKSGLVQRFESEEHQHLGDVATGTATYNLGSQSDKFELTHGDIMALSGDVFPPDELFRLAAIPGGGGKKVGTRDEILWALQDPRIWEMRAATSGPYAGKKDPRFGPGGPYAGYTYSKDYSDDIQKVVFNRYRKLGAANVGHFVAPQGRDASGAPLPASNSAGGTYRTLHEIAIKEADKAGRAGVNIDMAMAREAAAQHFLSDEFSAGHLRTPAAAIREYWGNKYPLFWYNLRHKIALDTAIEMTTFTSRAYTQVLASVEAMVPELPAVTLGDLLASVYHDVDNEQGLPVQGGGRVFGDKHLDAATEKLAIQAIQAGNKDITKAYELGKQMPNPVADVDLFAQVRTTSGGVGDKYAAETQVPEPSNTEPPQNWKAPDINTLWDQKFLGTTGDTVGQVITKKVQGGPISIQLNSLAENFPLTAKLIMHPRASYLKGFVKKLQADPKAGVLDIINWAPHGMTDSHTASAARESIADLEGKGAAGDKKENLGNMTLEQRVKFVNVLIKDAWFGEVSIADQDSIIKVFASAVVSDRPEIYKQIEGHNWAGDFQRKWGSRDNLYRVMNNKHVDTLKKTINGI